MEKEQLKVDLPRWTLFVIRTIILIAFSGMIFEIESKMLMVIGIIAYVFVDFFNESISQKGNQQLGVFYKHFCVVLLILHLHYLSAFL